MNCAAITAAAGRFAQNSSFGETLHRVSHLTYGCPGHPRSQVSTRRIVGPATLFRQGDAAPGHVSNSTSISTSSSTTASSCASSSA
jgi:hypothetical protein